MTAGTAFTSIRRGVLTGTAVVVALLVLVDQLHQRDSPLTGPSMLTAVFAVSFTALGALVLVGMPGHPVGRLMFAAGLVATVAVLALSWPPLAWLSQWLWWPPYALLGLALLIFPDGKPPGPRWRIVGVGLIGCAAVTTAAFAIAALDDPRGPLLSGELAATGRAQLLVRIALLVIAAQVLLLVAALVSLAGRWRRATSETRQQLACLLAAGALFLLGGVLDALDLAGAWTVMVVAILAIPGAMTLAVLRYRLYQLERVINRTLVWVVMSLLVIAGFVVIVALLRDLVVGANAALVATGLIAITFEPLRSRVQRGVNRLLYGDRDDPYAMLTRLGSLLERTGQPHAVPALLTDTIARSLRVPYVAVEVDDPEGSDLPDSGTALWPQATYGTPTTSVERFDMLIHGERVGQLVVAHRRTGDRFTPVERRILTDVARQATAAAATARLIRQLRESREGLVLAREEERRRLRRDLHDGLGPTFAGMSMQVRAASKLAAEAPRLKLILDGLAADLRTCTAEVRRLVDQLRPAALDQGLESALRVECQRFDSPHLAVHLNVDGDLRTLPAAVEVAAYRIVAEALSNVVRHARASRCEVRVRRSDGLLVEVTDDGIGMAGPRPGGVGLESIRHRAAELGGSSEIRPGAQGGTLVRVWLPWVEDA